MTLGLAALLVGIFVMPALLLLAGHRLRRRSPQWHSAFRGAVAGHIAALVIGSVAAMTPPALWTADDTLRGALGLWSFVALPVLGGSMALLAGKRRGNHRG